MRPHQTSAVAAACVVAARYGIRVAEPRLLKDCNNTIIHLAPLPLVAKVCSTSMRPCGPAVLESELEIARHLVRVGAPVVPPSDELPAEVHRLGDHAITWWRYCEHDPHAPVDAETMARALAGVHAALDTYPGPVPSFLTRQVRRAGAVLADPDALPALAAADRALLAAEHLRLVAELIDRHPPCRVLHGDPHRGNFLAGPSGCMVIDFESACTGPLEWDVSALPGGAERLSSLDPELLDLLRRLRSVCVAVWCWMRPGRAPEVDAAATFHLDLLRRGAAVPRSTQPSARRRSADPRIPPAQRRTKRNGNHVRNPAPA